MPTKINLIEPGEGAFKTTISKISATMAQTDKGTLMKYLILLINLVYPLPLRCLEALTPMQRIERLGRVTKVAQKGKRVVVYSETEVEKIEGIITQLVLYIKQVTNRDVQRGAMWKAIEKMRLHNHWDYKFQRVNTSLAKDVWSADHLGFSYLIFYLAFQEPELAYEKLVGPKRLCKMFPHRLVDAPRIQEYKGQLGQPLDYLKVHECLLATVQRSPPAPVKDDKGDEGTADRRNSARVPKPKTSSTSKISSKLAAPRGARTNRLKGKKQSKATEVERSYEKEYRPMRRTTARQLAALMKDSTVVVKEEEMVEDLKMEIKEETSPATLFARVVSNLDDSMLCVEKPELVEKHEVQDVEPEIIQAAKLEEPIVMDLEVLVKSDDLDECIYCDDESMTYDEIMEADEYVDILGIDKDAESDWDWFAAAFSGPQTV